jgi:hypothetical protein
MRHFKLLLKLGKKMQPLGHLVKQRLLHQGSLQRIMMALLLLLRPKGVMALQPPPVVKVTPGQQHPSSQSPTSRACVWVTK